MTSIDADYCGWYSQVGPRELVVLANRHDDDSRALLLKCRESARRGLATEAKLLSTAS